MSRIPTTRVSRACKSAGKTLEYLQQPLGIGVKIITQKAHGQGKDGKNLKRFTDVEIAKIADILGIPPKWLAGGGEAARIPSVFCGEEFDKLTHAKWNGLTSQLDKLNGEYFDDICDAIGFFSLIPIRSAIGSAVRGNRLFELTARIDELVKSMAIPTEPEPTTPSTSTLDTRHSYVLEPKNKPAALLYHVALKYLAEALDQGVHAEPSAESDIVLDSSTRMRINACLLKLQSENRRFQMKFVFGEEEVDIAKEIWINHLAERYEDLSTRLDSETFTVITKPSPAAFLEELEDIKGRIKTNRSKERSLKRNRLKLWNSGATERIPTPAKAKKSKARSTSAAGASRQAKKGQSKRVNTPPAQVKAPRRKTQTIPIKKTSENQRPAASRKTAPKKWTGKGTAGRNPKAPDDKSRKGAAGGKSAVRAKRRGGRDAGKTIKKGETRRSKGKSPRKKSLR